MPYVHLNVNVGGTLYTTSKMTLLKISDSMLAKICKPSWEEGGIGTTRENPIDIDRNGELFKYILDYLRQETWFTFPDEGITFFKQLFTEAHYFGISAMCEGIYETYLRPNNICVSPIGFKPMEGQKATLGMEDGQLKKRLALFLVFSEYLSGLQDDILHIEVPTRDPLIACPDPECPNMIRVESDDLHRRQDTRFWRQCCYNFIHLITAKSDALNAQMDAAVVTFVRIPSDPNMVDVKFVVGGDEYPKNGYVARMSLSNLRADVYSF